MPGAAAGHRRCPGGAGDPAGRGRGAAALGPPPLLRGPWRTPRAPPAPRGAPRRWPVGASAWGTRRPCPMRAGRPRPGCRSPSPGARPAAARYRPPGPPLPRMKARSAGRRPPSSARSGPRAARPPRPHPRPPSSGRGCSSPWRRWTSTSARPSGPRSGSRASNGSGARGPWGSTHPPWRGARGSFGAALGRGYCESDFGGPSLSPRSARPCTGIQPCHLIHRRCARSVTPPLRAETVCGPAPGARPPPPPPPSPPPPPPPPPRTRRLAGFCAKTCKGGTQHRSPPPAASLRASEPPPLLPARRANLSRWNPGREACTRAPPC